MATEPAAEAIVYVLNGEKVSAKEYKMAKRIGKRNEVRVRKSVKKYREKGIFS